MSIDYKQIQHERLPTLYEVLIQKSSAPADLWSFYTYLSQFPYAINYLEFWIDLMNHNRLCRHLINEIKNSLIQNNKNNPHLNEEDLQKIIDKYSNNDILPPSMPLPQAVSTPPADFDTIDEVERESLSNMPIPEQDEDIDNDNDSITSSILLNVLMNEGYLNPDDHYRMSKFFQGNIGGSNDYRMSQLMQNWQRHNDNSNSNNTRQTNTGETNNAGNNSNSNSYTNNTTERFAAMVDELLQNNRIPMPSPILPNTQENIQEQEDQANASSSSFLNGLTTRDLIKNARNICNLYLISPEKSKKYLINIPETIKFDIIKKIKFENRFDPLIFDDLQNLTYNFLEVDCFPKFLSKIALHNIHDQISDWRFHSSFKLTSQNRKSNRGLSENDNSSSTDNEKNYQSDNDDNDSMIYNIDNHISRSPFSNYTIISRLFVGFIWLGIGFWIGYTLIFLNYSRGIRVTTLPPFLFGCYYIICGLYQLDIFYSLFGVTQDLMFQPKRNLLHANKKIDKTTKKNLKHLKRGIPFFFNLFGGKKRLIKIDHPYIRNLLFKRGIWCAILVALSTAGLTVIFSVVPGWRV
ncbi:hypothetical protein TBLA_0D00840 [Henningerozyma blattae CBS 6284]|uniref:RGS domain-containing protein n=1 Tax=Henningerozyma blattae (strain ATCC 34711 / CBS 6284 / DSM 70876 / NBRC 10599 / NRRL Y-10934 / UCD 77-7) TaxID=1071380 RepID=I2H2J0_HENB6|nr:hypothetical protein TBLA_0D00840 [Tetrapisispora blattae CBS 6284]CCH60592.1 hypothetical protein TBLA_0D00840 [Tetrapisispora blattae CBS 6284]